MIFEMQIRHLCALPSGYNSLHGCLDTSDVPEKCSFWIQNSCKIRQDAELPCNVQTGESLITLEMIDDRSVGHRNAWQSAEHKGRYAVMLRLIKKRQELQGSSAPWRF